MWRAIKRSILAGVTVALLTLVIIKATGPSIFEDRADRVYEQCTKTGLAVFSFTLLVALARRQRHTS
jgi:hypothetical protein